ncbi:hypothetical protein STEG23_000908, partial [Scotinomys teguina]
KTAILKPAFPDGITVNFLSVFTQLRERFNLNTVKLHIAKQLSKGENLWIASRLIRFNQPRPPDSSQTAPVKIGPSS